MVELLNIAKLAAKKAGEAILPTYMDTFEINYKNDGSFITSLDIIANETIKTILFKTGIPFFSEEERLDKWKNIDKFWLIDPIDGTKGLVSKNGHFCICIALIINKKPVIGVIYDILNDNLYSAINDNKKIAYINNEKMVVNTYSRFMFINNKQRTNFGEKIKRYFKLESIHLSSALKFPYIANNLAFCYVRDYGSYIWDIAAGDAILGACGGEILDLKTYKKIDYTNIKNPNFIALSKHASKYKNEIFKLITQTQTY